MANGMDGGVIDLGAKAKARIEKVIDRIKDRLSVGKSTGDYYLTSEYSRHSRYCAAPGLLLVGDALAFLDPVFSSGVMLALKSGQVAGEAIHEGLLAGDLSPARFAAYGATIRHRQPSIRRARTDLDAAGRTVHGDRAAGGDASDRSEMCRYTGTGWQHRQRDLDQRTGSTRTPQQLASRWHGREPPWLLADRQRFPAGDCTTSGLVREALPAPPADLHP